MATVPAIAMGVRGIELQDPLTQYSRVAAIQHAQQQNQLARMQLEQSERDTQLRNRLRAFVPAMTPENRNQLLGYGAEGRAVYESLLKGEKDQREAEKSQRETEKAQEEIAAKRLKLARDLLPAVTTPEQYAEWYQYTTTQLPGLAKMIPQQFSPDVKQMLMMEADKALEQHFVNQNLGGSTRVVAAPKYGQGPARVVEGTEARVTMAPGEAERIANERVRIGLDSARLGLEGRRVDALEEKNRRDDDPAFQQRMEAARTVGRKAAEGDVAAVQALPKVISRAEEGVRLIDELIGKRDSKGRLIEGSKPHPGFQNAVGATWLPGARFIPGTDAAGFMSRFDQIKGASFLEAFESLKGGGAITEKEGQKGTDAINRMSTSTDEKEFIRAAMDLQDVIHKGVENAQKRAARAGGAAPAAPAAPAAGGVKFLGFE